MGQEIAQGIYYLKKCIVALQSAERLASLMPLCDRLIKEGISCKLMLSEELLPDGGLSEEVLCLGEAALTAGTSDETRLAAVAEEYPYMKEKQLEWAKDSDAEKLQGVLYLTDDPLLYPGLAAALQPISVCHPPVLIYFHSGNRDADFGDARYALEEPEETEPEYLERVYRRCYNLPWEILVTERCWLRETVEEDVDSFWKMYQDSELTRYTQQLYPTREAERGYVREYRRLVYSFYEFGVWTVLDRQSGVVVGRAGLSVREGYDLPELGFVISREWQGRGLAREVCQGILEYARESLGFERIQVLVHEENAASLFLCRKLGFREQAASNAAGESQAASDAAGESQAASDAAGESQAASGAAETSCGRQPDKRRSASSSCQPEKEQDNGFDRREGIKEGIICPSCLVELEQNGQKARFVYMVYEGRN